MPTNFRTAPFFHTLFTAVLLVTACALAAPSAVTAAEDLQHIVDQVASVYDTSGSSPLEGCPTRVVREATRRWADFTDEQRERLRHFVLMPGQSEPGGPAAPGAAGDAGFLSHKTENFTIHYKTEGTDAVRPGDGNGNGVPDYVELAGTYLETAFAREVGEMGFLAPPTVPNYLVFLKGLNHNGLTHPGKDQATWIEINANIEAYTRRVLGDRFGPHVSTDPDGIEAGLLKAVCAHEFFHAIQARYSWDQPDWWAEGTAEWMGEMVFPESDFYLNNLSLHFEHPHVSLFSNKLWFEYSASLFTGFLVQNLGGSEILRTIWEKCVNLRAPQAIQESAGDLRELYLLFNAYNVLKNYEDGDRYPDVEHIAVAKYPFSLGPDTIPVAEYYGANVFAFTGGSGETLNLSIAPASSGAELGLKAIVADDETGHWNILKVPATDDGFVLSVPEFGARNTRVTLIVANFLAEGTSPYSIHASLE